MMGGMLARVLGDDVTLMQIMSFAYFVGLNAISLSEVGH
jgi:hypothetical protein